jgi:hypothetical protein
MSDWPSVVAVQQDVDEFAIYLDDDHVVIRRISINNASYRDKIVCALCEKIISLITAKQLCQNSKVLYNTKSYKAVLTI